MKVYGLWHGGPNYGAGDMDHDLEVFESLRVAKLRFWMRANYTGQYPHTFLYADGREELHQTPCVEASSLTIWLTDPRECEDPYPDRILTTGPRGGVLSQSV